MARIGEFVATDNGYKGQVRTMEMRFDVQLVRIADAKAEGPHYQAVSANGADIGAAWDRKSQSGGEPYLRVNLDDPSMPRKIQANLVNEAEGKMGLMWQRPNRQVSRDREDALENEASR
ncbi:MAG: DUF736 domain-containing protein [Rhodospirillales bacterium]|nr:DUF736 domain-containing protein [Rhodospirillales bacterium]